MPKKPSPLHRPTEAELDANADALTQLAANPKLISGVYNTCDRWCERCPLTARCLVFQTEREFPQARAFKRPGFD